MPKQCRYLEEGNYCAFYDHQLLGDEDIRCYPGGWDCYEDPGPYGSFLYEGKWLRTSLVYKILTVPRWTCSFHPKMITVNQKVLSELVSEDGDYYNEPAVIPAVVKIPDGVTFQVIEAYFDRGREKLYGPDNGREI